MSKANLRITNNRETTMMSKCSIRPYSKSQASFSVSRYLSYKKQKMARPWTFTDHIGPLNFPAEEGMSVRAWAERIDAHRAATTLLACVYDAQQESILQIGANLP